ncbi:hypothetical protein MMAD_16510 [Mycolicibacterium madagascariense]|uniref:Esterase n=1 Tax=Mycolicibacterium madagascariense TaxID=212765 RepID=A0A7I7XCJ6_9MYCO|nr:hypothetical protein MMAD_16510 [Mycolicibacterium madagascariense]
MRAVSVLVRLACTVVLVLVAVGVGSSVGVAGAAPGYESLMVPSAAMGRDIPVAFLGGGPHAVYLLDAFDAAPDVSNWVTQGNAMGTLGGRGVSVVAPAGHGVVGASQGGYAALALATFHPDRFRYAGSMSGFLTPERTGIDGAITAGLMQYGGGHAQHVGFAAVGEVEVAFAECARSVVGGQQHSVVGVQSDDVDHL